jgi:hypothetical protein
LDVIVAWIAGFRFPAFIRPIRAVVTPPLSRVRPSSVMVRCVSPSGVTSTGLLGVISFLIGWDNASARCDLGAWRIWSDRDRTWLESALADLSADTPGAKRRCAALIRQRNAMAAKSYHAALLAVTTSLKETLTAGPHPDSESRFAALVSGALQPLRQCRSAPGLRRRQNQAPAPADTQARRPC